MEKKVKPIPEFLYDRIPGSERQVPLAEIVRVEGYKDGAATGIYDRRTTLTGEVVQGYVSEFVLDTATNKMVLNPKVNGSVSDTTPDGFIGFRLSKKPNPDFVRKSDNN
jgi:hypothetical protein